MSDTSETPSLDLSLEGEPSPETGPCASALKPIRQLFLEEESYADERMAEILRAWTRSHEQDDHIARVLSLAHRIRREFQVLVTVGIGGSDLSARVFHDTLNPAYHNLLAPEARGGAPEAYFTGDTFDPHRLHGLVEMLKHRGLLAKTLFNVISKSGRTGETIATLMILREKLQGLAEHSGGPESWRKQVLATTGLNEESTLYQMHRQSPFYTDPLPVPDGVGGRFSAFSPVGMLFLAATAGAGETPESRIQQARAGVREAVRRFRLPFDAAENLAYRLACWLHQAEVRDRKGTIVFYNYADNESLGAWFVQLYEESVQERDFGLNVIAAKGPTSNHSILNGILRGPRDKVILFLHWGDLGPDLEVPTGTGIGGDLAAFEGLSMTQVQTASLRGTVEDLRANGIPAITMSIPSRNTASLCCVMRLLMDMVAVKGRLQFLHINDAGVIDLPHELTYLQHGVEGYKKRTREQALQMKR